MQSIELLGVDNNLLFVTTAAVTADYTTDDTANDNDETQTAPNCGFETTWIDNNDNEDDIANTMERSNHVVEYILSPSIEEDSPATSTTTQLIHSNREKLYYHEEVYKYGFYDKEEDKDNDDTSQMIE